MADSNVPSVDMSTGRSDACLDNLAYGGDGSEDVSKVLGGGYAVKRDGAGKGRKVGDDGRPAPDSNVSINR